MNKLTILFLTMLLTCLPMAMRAESHKEKRDDTRYLAGAVPVVDGKVVFTTSHLSTYGVVGYNNVTETPTETKPEKNPTTSDINLALIISAIVISTIGVVITSKKISAKVTR